MKIVEGVMLRLGMKTYRPTQSSTRLNQRPKVRLLTTRLVYSKLEAFLCISTLSPFSAQPKYAKKSKGRNVESSSNCVGADSLLERPLAYPSASTTNGFDRSYQGGAPALPASSANGSTTPSIFATASQPFSSQFCVETGTADCGCGWSATIRHFISFATLDTAFGRFVFVALTTTHTAESTCGAGRTTSRLLASYTTHFYSGPSFPDPQGLG